MYSLSSLLRQALPLSMPPWAFVTSGKGRVQISLNGRSAEAERERHSGVQTFHKGLCMSLSCALHDQSPPRLHRQWWWVSAKSVWETIRCPRDCCRLCSTENYSFVGGDSLQAWMKTTGLSSELEKKQARMSSRMPKYWEPEFIDGILELYFS